jgi:3',5'-cyclic AMP phosphodiesterase CpdA
MVRLAHLSDIHITAAPLGWRLRDWTSKRATSWLNYRWLGRRRRFQQADHILTRLRADLPKRGIDHIVFSGDATALGFETEFARAAAVLRVGEGSLPGMAVPGNHDYCTRAAARSGFFEHHFDPWQQGRRTGPERYPFAQRVGPLWLVGVNAATGNRLPWDASGEVGTPQLERLRILLRDLEAGPRVLVIHYPVALADGAPEPVHHRLRDVRRVVEVAAAGSVSLWLHGHRHRPYYLPSSSALPFPAICVGSATQSGISSYNEYTIEGHKLEAVRRTFDEKQDAFCDREIFELSLPG